MEYLKWLEAQKMTDDAEARRLYAERDSGISHPYHDWRERYGYADTATARADYKRYREGLELLTQADLQAFTRLLDQAADGIREMRDYQEYGEGVGSVFCGYRAALEALGDAMQIALDVSIRERG